MKISPIVMLVSPIDGFQLLIQFLTPISTENQPSKLSLLKSFKKSKNIIESYRIFHLPILFDELIFNSIDVNLAVGSVEGKTYHFSINSFELPNNTTCDLQDLIEKIYSHLLWSSGNIVYYCYIIIILIDIKFSYFCYSSLSIGCIFNKLLQKSSISCEYF